MFVREIVKTIEVVILNKNSQKKGNCSQARIADLCSQFSSQQRRRYWKARKEE